MYGWFRAQWADNLSCFVLHVLLSQYKSSNGAVAALEQRVIVYQKAYYICENIRKDLRTDRILWVYLF